MEKRTPILWVDDTCTKCNTRVSSMVTRIELDYHTDERKLVAHVLCPVCKMFFKTEFEVMPVKNQHW